MSPRHLNENLERLADETQRRGAALDAARAFAAAATHELRTPLQGALLNLDMARSGRITDGDRAEVLGLANQQLQRMGTSLSAVRALADAEFADQSWFGEVDLADVADAAVADECRRAPNATVTIEATPPTTIVAWRDGVALAIANVVRNTLVHGAPDRWRRRTCRGDRRRRNRHRRRQRARCAGTGPGTRAWPVGRGAGGGSGLGLSIAQQVALAHGGSVTITRARSVERESSCDWRQFRRCPLSRPCRSTRGRGG